MAVKKITGPGWVYLAHNEFYSESITKYKPLWMYIAEGHSTYVDEVDGYYYPTYHNPPKGFVYDKDPDSKKPEHEDDITLYDAVRRYDPTDPEWCGCESLILFRNSGRFDNKGGYADWLETGRLSNTNPFIMDLPMEAFNLTYNAEKQELLYDNTDPADIESILYVDRSETTQYKFRIKFGDVYFILDRFGYLHKDRDQSAVRAARFPTNTECTKTTVTNRTKTDTGKSKSSTLGSVNKNANSDTLLGFATKLNALSNNTPTAFTRQNKRALSESIVKEEPFLVLEAKLNTDTYDYPELREEYYSEGSAEKFNPNFNLADFDPDAQFYVYDSFRTDREGDTWHKYAMFGEQITVKYDGLYTMYSIDDFEVSVVDRETGKPFKFQFWNPYWNNDEPYVAQTEPPEGWDEYPTPINGLHILPDADYGDWGFHAHKITVTFKLKESTFQTSKTYTFNGVYVWSRSHA